LKASESPSLRGRTISAPSERTSSASASEALVAARMPACFASCSTDPPSIPAPPVTSSSSPAFSPVSSSDSIAVSAFIGTVAAATRSVPSGTEATCSAGTQTYWVCAPPACRRGFTTPITGWPGFSVTPSPTAWTWPENSIPAT